MVQEENRQSLYQEYMASAIKILAESYVKCHGGDVQLPSFIEMTHEKQSNPTAKQVIEHVKKLFS